MERKKKYIAIAMGMIVLAAAVSFFAGTEVKYRFAKATAGDGVVFVPTGGGFGGLMDSLEQQKLLKNPAAFRRIASWRKLEQKLKPGRYEVKKGMTYAAVINRFKSGAQSPVRLTFNNIRTPELLADAVSARLETDSAGLLAALQSDSVAASYGYTPATFLGMFLPDTYEFYWNTSVEDFLARMKRESDRFWEKRADRLATTGLTREQAMTLASIVYEETKRQDEMARVAGVYMNRLGVGMPLQADPTVKFALGDFSIRRVLFKHLEVDSPYNTYKNAGLPPGLICMPSIAAIDAVLNAEKHNYLYFCAKDDLSGYHNFAVTLAEHNRNAQAYAAALNRLKIQ